jgi:hypothetical protein
LNATERKLGKRERDVRKRERDVGIRVVFCVSDRHC